MDKLVTLLDLCPSSSSHSTNLRLFCQVAFLSLKGAAMDSCMNGYANWCKLKVDMSMHHAYDKSWKTMGDISKKKPHEPTRFPHAGFANWNIHKNTDLQQMGYTRNTWFNVFNEQCQFVATVSICISIFKRIQLKQHQWSWQICWATGRRRRTQLWTRQGLAILHSFV